MTGPLQGIRVIDLTSVISGPASASMLADQGADVIKVEALSGDMTRHSRAHRRLPRHVHLRQPRQARHRPRPQEA